MVRFLCCFPGLFLTSFGQEFSDPRDADDARYNLDGREVDGSRIVVEFAKGVGITSFQGFHIRFFVNFFLYLIYN